MVDVESAEASKQVWKMRMIAQRLRGGRVGAAEVDTGREGFASPERRTVFPPAIKHVSRKEKHDGNTGAPAQRVSRQCAS